MTQVTTNFKTGKRIDDPKYRKHVRTMPCVICEGLQIRQNSPTEFHHTICGRHSGGKTSCCFGIPLCHSHHHKMRPYRGDESRFGIHNDKSGWVELFGLDTDYIADIQKAVEQDHGYTPKGL